MIETPVTGDDMLHAYIDGEMPESDRSVFEQNLAEDPELAARVALFEGDKARTAQVYGALADAPLPARWIEMIEQSGARHRGRPVWFSIEAIAGIAAVLMLLIGGSLVYRQGAPHEEAIVQEALAARSDILQPGGVIRIGTAQQTSTARKLGSILAMHVGVPDLTRMGYRLVGLRVYKNVPGGNAAELIYRHKDNRVFSLYLRHPSGPARFDQFRQGSLRVCIWQDNVLGAVMTGEMSAAEMQRLASLAYNGLEA